MHEYHIVQQIVKQAIETAKINHASKITKINLVMQEPCSLDGSSLQLYFADICRNTIAQEAELNLKNVPAKLKCQGCAREFEVSIKEFSCPECGGLGVLLRENQGLSIENIEIESA